MSDAVLVALISAGTTIISAFLTDRTAKRNAAKQSIMQMILEDHVSVSEGHLPTNYQNILHEYDIYHKHGGNSYITEKVEEYKTWFLKVQGGKK